MSYNIAINIKLKNNLNVSGNENLIYDIANNLNSKYIYYDYELEGVNKYIKKNNKIIILEFDEEIDLINFLKFITSMREILIEYIYYENSILYSSKNYLVEVSKRLHNKNNLLDKIEANKKNDNFKKIYDVLNF